MVFAHGWDLQVCGLRQEKIKVFGITFWPQRVESGPRRPNSRAFWTRSPFQSIALEICLRSYLVRTTTAVQWPTLAPEEEKHKYRQDSKFYSHASAQQRQEQLANMHHHNCSMFISSCYSAKLKVELGSKSKSLVLLLSDANILTWW